MDKTGPVFHPMISSIQKIALYETRGNFYLVGSNNTQTRFRVLKIDRSEPNDLLIYDDKTEYTVSEILDLINMIESGNRVRSVNGGFSKVISAFGIVGFIKFLEGYYIILITKRRKVALIGHHTIYKIEDTNMIYIPHETVRSIHPDEPRYVKMFQSIDLASNFYYSYSYDLTHTLQHNLTDPKQFMSNRNAEESHFDIPEDRNNLLTCSIVSTNNGRTETHKSEENYGIRITPNRKFVWNTHLLKDAESELHPDWLLYITHGFIGQSNITVFGRSLYLTLIARRSCRYAGTRFLKRGANFQGDVANEVETEQIVHDSCVSSLSRSHITSFVQMRGSIPGHWKQDMGKMVRKPAITIDLNDPYSETAAFHFNELLKRYGTPIIVLNLVKQRERKKQERLLSDELSSSIKYLNQFLPPEHQIIYKTFDMARKNKANVNVLRHLADIAKACVMKTGLFHNQKKYFAQKQSTVVGQDKSDNKNFSLQTGIIRTNCVDCLDRTNAAQFAIGKCVLGYQLCSLGIVDSPDLEFGTDCVRMLESLYEDHGDTLALQYGGSQLVHRVKTYRKTAPWTSQGNDIMQTLSRYYSNKFSDAEKQNTINLFLGLFVPEENKPQIWEFSTDYFFHHKPILCSNKSLTQWWDGNVMKCLPYAYNDMSKACYEIIQVHSKEIDMIDSYYDYHRPYELTILSDHYAFKISNSIRDFMPNFTTNYSPFALRVRPVKHREETSNKGHSMKNPSVTGQSSTSSTTSSASSSTDEGSCDEEDSVNTNESNTLTPSQDIHPSPVTFKSLFPSMKDVYGTEVTTPEPKDLLLYKKYVLIGKRASKAARKSSVTQFGSSSFQAESVFRDNFREVKPPSVPEKSLKIYENYVNLGKTAGNEPSEKDLEIYRKYARFSA